MLARKNENKNLILINYTMTTMHLSCFNCKGWLNSYMKFYPFYYNYSNHVISDL